MSEKLLLIDANSVIHRAYHAIPPLSSKDGEMVNAIYGSLLLLFRVLSEFTPNYVAVAFDLPGKTFRHKKYTKYKAQRPKTPEDLCKQIEMMKQVFSAFNIPVFYKEGYEADDVIGTLSHKFKDKQVIIVSGDLDGLQLAGGNIKVYILRKGVKDTVLYGEKEVKEKYNGLVFSQVVDMKALKGDASDNIPGVEGVGEKTAISLIKKFGNIENLYTFIEEDKNCPEISVKLKEKLIRDKEKAFMSKYLSLIEKNVPINTKIKKFYYDEGKVINLLHNLGFESLINRLPQQEKRSTAKLW